MTTKASMEISGQQLKKTIQRSFDEALVLKSQNKFAKSNALKSSLLVSYLGQYLYDAVRKPNIEPNFVKVDSDGNKEPGEWLLDIAITENEDGFRKQILWAVESETNCGWKAFSDDFAKLTNLRALNYLYMNGLNHKTERGRDNYINTRLEKATAILNETQITSFYFGFWASPCKPDKNIDSIWDALPDGKFHHLMKVKLYHYEVDSFSETK